MASEVPGGSSDGGLRPASRWFNSPDSCEDTSQGDVIDIVCDSQEFTAEIFADPGYSRVRLRYGRHLELRIAENVDVELFALEIIPSSGTESSCEIHGPAPHLRCGVAPSAAEDARPRLRLQEAGPIDVECGNWTIEPLADPSDMSAILSFRPESSVVLDQGSATFTTRLEGVSISGTGNVTAEDGIHESAVELCGDLDVRGDVVACVIKLSGDFEATGLVVLGNESLKCHIATIRAFA